MGIFLGLHHRLLNVRIWRSHLRSDCFAGLPETSTLEIDIIPWRLDACYKVAGAGVFQKKSCVFSQRLFTDVLELLYPKIWIGQIILPFCGRRQQRKSILGINLLLQEHERRKN